MARIGLTALTVLVAGLALAATASAVSPDVQAMNLQAADVPGAKVTTERAVTEKGYVAAHFRSFVFSAPASGSRLIGIESETALGATAATATTDVAKAEKYFRSKNTRKAFIAATAKTLKVKAKAVSLGQPHAVGGYDQGIEVATSIGVKGGRPIGAGVTAQYATAIAAHIGTELAPLGLAAPTVSGTAQQGQTLTASPGSWTATDATFAYQWQHCDSAGANCVDIAGATAQTYAVTPTDVGATLHVVVKATNRFGSATAPSAPSPVVT
jgi:hypothetical protein